ncbi:Fur-regulated basic protein FbpC [Bacillus kexueae]|nr:Fur-regulated basic protein FbpC [Bacillus kexueae]
MTMFFVATTVVVYSVMIGYVLKKVDMNQAQS